MPRIWQHPPLQVRIQTLLSGIVSTSFLLEPEVEKGALDSLSLKSEDTENSR